MSTSRPCSPSLALVALALAASMLAACGSSSSVASGSASPTGNAAPQAERFVVFDLRTPLCREARLDDAVCARAPVDSSTGSYDGVARVLDDRGAWLRVETTDRWQVTSHCADGSSDALGQLGLHVAFFIQREALLPVTTAQEIAFGNGTRVAFRSGIPLLPGEEGTPPDLARIDGGFPMLVARKSVQTSEVYEPSPPIVEAAQPKRIGDGRTMRYGVPLPALDFPPYPTGESRGSKSPEAAGVVRDPFADTYVYAESPHDAGVLVELRARCATLHAVVAPDAIVPAPPMLGSRHSIMSELRAHRVSRTSRYRVRAGAALTYLDGSPAGRVGELDVPFQGELRPAPGRVCMDRRVALASGPRKPTPQQIDGSRITLCVAERDAMPWPRFWSDTEAASLHPDTKTILVVEVESRNERDAASVTAEVRAAIRDAFLVGRGHALAPASLGYEAARSFAASHGANAVRILVVVGPTQVSRTPAPGPGAREWFNVRQSLTAELVGSDGSSAQVPLLVGGSSPGADDVVDGKLTQAFLDEDFQRVIEQAASSIRTRLLAGERPPDVQGVASVRELPLWAMPPGFSPPR